MKSLSGIIALFILLTQPSIAIDSIHIVLSPTGYESAIKKAGLLDQLKVYITLANTLTPPAPQSFRDSDYLVIFSVSTDNLIKILCAPDVSGDFLIQPEEFTAPFPQNPIKFRVTLIADYLRTGVENEKKGMVSLLHNQQWAAARNLYNEVTRVLDEAETLATPSKPSIFFQEFTFRDDILQSLEDVANEHGYQEGDSATPKEFLDLYVQTLFDGIRTWKRGTDQDQQLPRLFVLLDRWRTFAYFTYLAADSSTRTFYRCTLGAGDCFRSDEAKKKFKLQWNTIANYLQDATVFQEIRATHIGVTESDTQEAINKVIAYLQDTSGTPDLHLLDIEKTIDYLKASHKVQR